jgi:hypothetical protein
MAATTSKASDNDPAVEETAKAMADEDGMPPLPLTQKNLALFDALNGNPDSDIHTDNSAYLFKSTAKRRRRA